MKKLMSILISALLLAQITSCAKTDADKTIGGSEISVQTTETQTEGITNTETATDSIKVTPTGELTANIVTEKKNGKTADEKFSSGVLDYSFNLFSSVLDNDEKGKNTLISPLSILIALSLTANGADGETRTQMESVLGGLTVDELNSYLVDYSNELTSSETAKLNIANSVWVRDEENRLTVSEEFLNNAVAYYASSVFKEKFDERTCNAINAWISENTDGMINNMLSEIPEEAVLYLINAITFEAEWQNKYDEYSVRETDFKAYSGKTEKAQMMYSEENYYLDDGKASGFLKYYGDTRYAFAALLPEEGTDVYEYASSLDGKTFTSIIKGAENAHISAGLVQFSYDYKKSLVKALDTLGMKDAFISSAADLTRLGRSKRGNLFISNVLHKAFIEVSPAGTKAGAATVVEACDTGAPVDNLKSYSVILDRPFVYAIVDIKTGIPIFIGITSSVEK